MSTGMLLGKFLPPHQGHVYLAEFARNYVDDLAIIVCSIEREPIPGEIRFQWMREMFPDCRVVHLTDKIPQHPSEHPDFWNIWLKALERILPFKPDHVFASDDYGLELAEILGARFVPVDKARRIVPVSGTAIRNDPMGNWRFLPRCVRPHFLRRVCIMGPESTGKSTLAAKLAERFETALAPEYARTLLESQDGRIGPADIERIARGQAACEDAVARNANKVLICDTDLLTTMIWSEMLFGSSPPWVCAEAERRRYDLYLLTDVDVPFVADAVRYLPEQRWAFLARCRKELDARGRRYVLLSGDWDRRFELACSAVEELLGARR
jgi:NadR type nicotinamide-nucleotide adenylyltransferase